MPARLHPLFLLPLTTRSPLTYNVPMKTLIYIIGIFFLQTSCYQQEFHPESGDLIFQVGIAGGMTEAIADATGGESDLSFTHVGIITVEPAGIYVLEAKSEPGVTMTPLQKFLDSSATIEGRPAAAIARITLPERRELATRAIGEAKKYLGQPYDDSFLPHNGKMYCSELVWECYLTGSKTNIFHSPADEFPHGRRSVAAILDRPFRSNGPTDTGRGPGHESPRHVPGKISEDRISILAITRKPDKN